MGEERQLRDPIAALYQFVTGHKGDADALITFMRVAGPTPPANPELLQLAKQQGAAAAWKLREFLNDLPEQLQLTPIEFLLGYQPVAPPTGEAAAILERWDRLRFEADQLVVQGDPAAWDEERVLLYGRRLLQLIGEVSDIAAPRLTAEPPPGR